MKAVSLIASLRPLQRSLFHVTLGIAAPAILAASTYAATFTPLGYLPGASSYSEALDVSADGQVVVGQSFRGAFGSEAFRWTAAGGMEGLGDLPTGDYWSAAHAASGDGNVVVGIATAGQFAGNDGFRWTSGSGMQPTGYLTPNSYSYTLGVSADGSVAVGDSRSAAGNEAFRWTAGGGLTGLGDLSGGTFESFANDVSADGKVVVGASRSASTLEAFRWTQETGMVGLGFLSGQVGESQAWAVSADRNTIVGSTGTHGWQWTAATGLVEIPRLPTGGIIPADVSANGSVIVGTTLDTTDATQRIPAFIWTAQFGTENLQQFLAQNYGLDLPGWTLTKANGISDDGHIIVGRGVDPLGHTQAWVINLSVPEPSAFSMFAMMLFFACTAHVRLHRNFAAKPMQILRHQIGCAGSARKRR